MVSPSPSAAPILQAFRAVPRPLAPLYREHLKNRFLAVSCMTVAELYRRNFRHVDGLRIISVPVERN